MSDEDKRRRRLRKNLWLLLAALIVLLAAVVVPPLVNIGRYKSQIARLLSVALGRPARLSSVELRIFPRPGFVLTDLTVDEDPSFGSEPVLHANTVTAAIRMLSLWRGRLEISRISVDEASLNVVRTVDGRWNLDPFFRTPATRSNGAAQRETPPIPYLEATNSRVNIKNGMEKLPFSLVNADLSFWQENPGDWRLRLRGQPARTDVNLDLADTGIVRLEATLRHAPEFRLMPVHLEMEWREAQLGQLSRLIIGSDPGWRGDLRGQLQLDGTAAAAEVKTRLSATSVHRVEFAPADPLDFDANCSFVYHYSVRSVENVACDSPLGDGHIQVAGNVPGSAPGRLSIQMQRIPVSAGLDVLRTLRSGIGQELEARGTLSGQLTYDPGAAQKPLEEITQVRRRLPKGQAAKDALAVPGPLSGTLSIDGFVLSGDGLSEPIQPAKVIFQPVIVQQGQAQTLTTTVSLPAGAPAPLTLSARFSLRGYQLVIRGPAALARIRELARISGIADSSLLDGLTADPAALDLNAHGQWLPVQTSPASRTEPEMHAGSDQLSGTLILHNAKWKSDSLANPVTISEAMLRLDEGKAVWSPLAFEYGPIKGVASVQPTPTCGVAEQCPPQVALEFSELDAAALQAELLGTHRQGTVFSNLVARLSPTSAAIWPQMDGTLKANSLILGPVKLQNAAISFRVLPRGAEFSSIDAGLFGGFIHANGKLASGDKPHYALEGTFAQLTGASMCQLFALQCTGGPIDGNGKIELSGFLERELAESANGTLHFEWRKGAIRPNPATQIPAALTRFDRWTGDTEIANSKVTVKQSRIQQGAREIDADGTIAFGAPPLVRVTIPNPGNATKNNAPTRLKQLPQKY